MKPSYALVFLLIAILISWTIAGPATADESHARIVRLSLVQGDVRFTQQFHKDSMSDQRAGWEVAPPNLPIRQGYAVATGSDGRAEVEFENGAMAFLNANTVIEFYDLSLYDGSLITRLVLRQGSSIFYVHPARGDYFSVTGGDFSVEADGRSRFRLDNFDDGSNVSVEMGHVNVLRKEETKSLTKGQSYFVNVNEGGNGVVGRAPDNDDFDKWVSGRIDSVATATAYANQYVNSPNYSSGFADLYTYGSWYNLPGYGFGWQPFGAGMGWCPFSNGNWFFDASIGWSFIGGAPWGWLPYHYGGWVFSPMYGWVWVPTGFGYGGYYPYRPVTGVWVHNGTTTGLVPLHPTDGHGRPPVNLGHGIYALNGSTVARTTMMPAAGEKWSVEKHPARNTLEAAKFASIPAPARVSRTILSSNVGSRPVTVSRDSSIVYDGNQHRFVNGNSTVKVNNQGDAAKNASVTGAGTRTATAGPPPAHATNVAAPPHGSTVPRPNIAPPRPAVGSVGTSHSSGAGASWGGSHGSSSSSSGSSTHGSSSSAGSAGGGSHASSGGSSHH
jgi:uncharacterized membrane protein YgcG